MENIILIIHLVIALFLIAVILLQRSEGGALGMGGGGGGGEFLTGRGAASALTKATWGLGAAFIATSMLLTILAVRGTRDITVVDPGAGGEAQILIPDLVDSPLAPPSGESPATPPAE